MKAEKHQNTEPQQIPPADDKSAAFWKERNGSRQTYRAICEKPENDTQADLCQQWRVAEETKHQAKWALPQFIASVATVVGLLITIVLTARATGAATRAAIAAEKSADMLPQMERAYVFLDGVDANIVGSLSNVVYSKKNDSIRIRFHLLNGGKTPALIREIYADITIDSDMREPTYKTIVSKPREVVLAAEAQSDQFTIDLRSTLTPAVGEAVHAGTAHINFYGKVIYDDVFGEEHTTPWWLQYIYRKNSLARTGDPKWNQRT